MKFKRNIPQTCWMDLATGKRIGGVSVAEHIESYVLPLYGARDSKFLSGKQLHDIIHQNVSKTVEFRTCGAVHDQMLRGPKS